MIVKKTIGVQRPVDAELGKRLAVAGTTALLAIYPCLLGELFEQVRWWHLGIVFVGHG